MNDQLKKTLDSFKQFWANTPGKVKKAILAGAILVVVGALVFALLINVKDYVVIFQDLSESDVTEILAVLQTEDISVQVQGEDTILVPSADEAAARMAVASAGYPKNGLSYYLIEENSGMLTTDYEKKQYANLQLQERIAASIETLEGVKEAVVTITAPSEKVFYLQETEEPTASVVIHMKDGFALSASQIAGIQNLVAKSVTGLTRDNIALIDSQGNDLMGSVLSDDPDFLKVSLTREIESDIKKKIYAVLEGPYDDSKIKVSVTADIDTDALIKEETLYSPSIDGNNSGVISEESTSSDTSTSTDGSGGVAGTDSNSEVTTYPETGSSGGSSSQSTTSDTKYQVSQIKSQSQKSGAVINSISIGIAIDKKSFDPGERESIVELVSYAAGVAPEDVTVQNFSFAEAAAVTGPTAEELAAAQKKKLIMYGGIGGGALLLIGALVMILLRGKKKKKTQEEVQAQHVREESGRHGETSMDELFGQRESYPTAEPITAVTDSRSAAIKDFAKDNPEIVAQMIKSWLRSEND